MKNWKSSTFGVIGLGRFGTALAKTLAEAEKEVIVVDCNEEKVRELRHYTEYAFVTDNLSKDTLQEIGIQNCGTVIVCIGEKIDTSILTTLNVVSLGVPHVIAKAISSDQGAVLEKIGADKIIYPERDMGKRVAHNLISSSIVDYIEMSNNISLMSTNIPHSLVGKNLIESDLRKRYNVNVVAIKHEGVTYINPKPTQVLEEGDEMIVIGEHQNIKALEEIV